MSNRFEYVEFNECDVNDSFFDSLKMDYPEFESWFQRKSKEHEKAYSHPCDKINIDDKIGTELYKTGQQCRPEKQQNKPSVSDPADTMLINKPVTEKKGSPYHTYTGRNIEPESYNIQRSTQKSSDKNKTKIGLI